MKWIIVIAVFESGEINSTHTDFHNSFPKLRFETRAQCEDAMRAGKLIQFIREFSVGIIGCVPTDT